MDPVLRDRELEEKTERKRTELLPHKKSQKLQCLRDKH